MFLLEKGELLHVLFAVLLLKKQVSKPLEIPHFIMSRTVRFILNLPSYDDVGSPVSLHTHTHIQKLSWIGCAVASNEISPIWLDILKEILPAAIYLPLSSVTQASFRIAAPTAASGWDILRSSFPNLSQEGGKGWRDALLAAAMLIKVKGAGGGGGAGAWMKKVNWGVGEE